MSDDECWHVDRTPSWKLGQQSGKGPALLSKLLGRRQHEEPNIRE